MYRYFFNILDGTVNMVKLCKLADLPLVVKVDSHVACLYVNSRNIFKESESA